MNIILGVEVWDKDICFAATHLRYQGGAFLVDEKSIYPRKSADQCCGVTLGAKVATQHFSGLCQNQGSPPRRPHPDGSKIFEEFFRYQNDPSLLSAQHVPGKVFLDYACGNWIYTPKAATNLLVQL